MYMADNQTSFETVLKKVNSLLILIYLTLKILPVFVNILETKDI